MRKKNCCSFSFHKMSPKVEYNLIKLGKMVFNKINDMKLKKQFFILIKFLTNLQWMPLLMERSCNVCVNKSVQMLPNQID